MKDAVQTAIAAAPAATAPAWVPVLEQVNVALTTVSLILGAIGAIFAIWRGIEWARNRRAS
jgi:phage-related minor tail protein